MTTVINFFALRPTFTFFGLKVVWYLYLLSAIVQVVVAALGISQALAQRGMIWQAGLPSFIPLVVGAIAQIAIIRLLLEVAAIAVSSRTEQSSGR